MYGWLIKTSLFIEAKKSKKEKDLSCIDVFAGASAIWNAELYAT